MICESCGNKRKVSEFAPTTSAFFPSGRINICFTCIKEAVDGDDLNEVDRFLQHCNIAFFPNEWRKMWKREEKDAFKKYTNTYYDLKMAKYDWGEQNKKLMEKARNGVIDNELDELKDSFIQKLRLKWGDLDKLDLIRLEKYFNASLTDYNVQTEAQKDMLRKICRLSILIDDDLIQGEVDKNKITQYDKLMTSTLKTLETTQSDGITSVSELMAFVEQNGFQPNFYNDTPRDEIDFLKENIQEFVADTIRGEVNLTEIYENQKRLIKNREEEE